MKYALFTGCTIPARALNYELSARKVAEAFGIEFVDINEPSCCGMPMRNVNRDACLAMSANTLAKASDMGLELVTLCSACNSTLSEASVELAHDKELRRRINTTLEKSGSGPYTGDTKVWHFTRLLHEKIGPEKISQAVKRPLTGINFVSHAGCHYLKPSETFKRFDDPEAPTTLDALIKATGANSIIIMNRNECCGGGILGIREATSIKVASGKLQRIKARGNVDGMVLHCPFCNIQYEGNQKKAEKEIGEPIDLPVLYLPQVIGLAIGIDEKDLGFNLNRVKPKTILDRLAVGVKEA